MSRNWTYEEVEALFAKWQPDAMNATGLRVLVADADVALRASLTELLEQTGFDVAEATDGLQALRQIRNAPPDVCVFDCDLPRVGGLEIMETLRADAVYGHIPVILLLSSREKKDHLVARRGGARAVFAKPVKADEVARKICQLAQGETAGG